MGFDLSIPATMIVVATFMVLVTKWVFKPSRRPTGRPQSGPGANLGMLTPVLVHSGRAAAIAAKDRLSRQGIRCSLSRVEIDCYDVLVFTGEADRALRLLADN